MTPIDTHSGPWKAVKRHLLELIETEHTRLEDPERTEAETNVSRGRIAAARDLLNEFDPKEPSLVIEKGDTYDL